MKKTFHIQLLVLLICLITACRKMDSMYKQYSVPGGLTYVGKATSPKAYSGLNRVKVAWLRGADPSVTKARVFWNNFSDSVSLDIPPTGDTVSVMIENLQEKSYTFVIRTYDANGNSSIPIEVVGGSFGEKYASQLLTRPVNTNVLNSDGTLTINWGGADESNGAYLSEVKYTDLSGNIKHKIFSVKQPASEITDMKPYTTYQFRTIFRPDSLAIDYFYTSYTDGSDYFAFSKKQWKIVGYSTQHDSGVNSVNNFIDGTETTRWHTCAGCSSYPHFAAIDMGVEKMVTQVGIWRTTFDVPAGDDRGPDKFEILTSDDNVNWVSQGVFTFNRVINGEQRFQLLKKPKARYIKFVGLQGPQGYMVLGEFSAYGL